MDTDSVKHQDDLLMCNLVSRLVRVTEGNYELEQAKKELKKSRKVEEIKSYAIDDDEQVEFDAEDEVVEEEVKVIQHEVYVNEPPSIMRYMNDERDPELYNNEPSMMERETFSDEDIPEDEEPAEIPEDLIHLGIISSLTAVTIAKL